MWARTPRRAWPLFVVLLATSAAIAEEELPSAELLEFLGSWESADGRWIDPLELLDSLEESDDDGEQEGTHDE